MGECAKCLLGEPVVPLGSDGVCSLCAADDHNVFYLGEDRLRKILDHHRSDAKARGASYDCLVPISGGKDSTDALLKLVRDYGMRPVAFHYNHAFIDPTAVRNVDVAVAKLGVPLVRNEDSAAQMRYLKHNLRELKRVPRDRRLGRMFTLLCVGCSLGYGKAALKVASDHGIRLIVQGGCPVEPELRLFTPVPVGRKRRKAIVGMAFRELKDVLTLRILRTVRYRRNIYDQTLVLRTLWAAFARKLPKFSRNKIQRISLFSFIEWNEDQVVDEITRELDWIKPSNRSTTTRFDCSIHILRDKMCLDYLGISDKENMYSQMIRKNMISREEARRRVEIETAEERALSGPTLWAMLQTLELEELWKDLAPIWGLDPLAPPQPGDA
jgi:hypothetical protein